MSYSIQKILMNSRIFELEILYLARELQGIETIKQMCAEEHLRPQSITRPLDTMKVTKRRGKNGIDLYGAIADFWGRGYALNKIYLATK